MYGCPRHHSDTEEEQLWYLKAKKMTHCRDSLNLDDYRCDTSNAAARGAESVKHDNLGELDKLAFVLQAQEHTTNQGNQLR